MYCYFESDKEINYTLTTCLFIITYYIIDVLYNLGKCKIAFTYCSKKTELQKITVGFSLWWSCCTLYYNFHLKKIIIINTVVLFSGRGGNTRNLPDHPSTIINHLQFQTCHITSLWVDHTPTHPVPLDLCYWINSV